MAHSAKNIVKFPIRTHKKQASASLPARGTVQLIHKVRIVPHAIPEITVIYPVKYTLWTESPCLHLQSRAFTVQMA